MFFIYSNESRNTSLTFDQRVAFGRPIKLYLDWHQESNCVKRKNVGYH